MRISPIQYRELLLREARNNPPAKLPAGDTGPESGIHQKIMDYCNGQWPPWLYIRARMDKRSTIAPGAQDFTIFAPGSRVLCVECKRTGEKLSTDQLIWHKQMEMLGHQVHTVTGFDQFLAIVGPPKMPQDDSGHPTAMRTRSEP